jgi:DNA-binding HxlR family transcriptional regulator
MQPIDFNGLDTHVHGPIRLGILTALQMDGALDFSTLKKRLETADGSLNLHLRRLEENGYITSNKAFVALRPRTTYELTPTGRKALSGYLQAMRKLLDALEPAEPTPARAPTTARPRRA